MFKITSHSLLAITFPSPFIPAFPRVVFCEHLHALGTPRAGDIRASVRRDTSGCGLCWGWEQGQVLSYCLSHVTAHDLGLNYLAGWLDRILPSCLYSTSNTNGATNIESV